MRIFGETFHQLDTRGIIAGRRHQQAHFTFHVQRVQGLCNIVNGACNKSTVRMWLGFGNYQLCIGKCE